MRMNNNINDNGSYEPFWTDDVQMSGLDSYTAMMNGELFLPFLVLKLECCNCLHSHWLLFNGNDAFAGKDGVF